MPITGLLYNRGHYPDEYVEWVFGAPDRGRGPFAQYMIDWHQPREHGFPEGLVYIERSPFMAADWYMRRWSAWPLVRAWVWLRFNAYFPTLRWMRRRGWIVKPEYEAFSWRRHFRPLRRHAAC